MRCRRRSTYFGPSNPMCSHIVESSRAAVVEKRDRPILGIRARLEIRHVKHVRLPATHQPDPCGARARAASPARLAHRLQAANRRCRVAPNVDGTGSCGGTRYAARRHRSLPACRVLGWRRVLKLGCSSLRCFDVRGGLIILRAKSNSRITLARQKMAPDGSKESHRSASRRAGGSGVGPIQYSR